LERIIEEESMPKFDVVVGNPPYKKNLHLKFLELAYNSLKKDGKIVWIHPARWMQDPLAPMKKGSDFLKYKDLPFTDFKIISSEKARELFDNGITTDLVISYLEAGQNSILGEEKIYELRQIPSELNRIFKFTLPSLNDLIEKDRREGIRVQIRSIIPNIGGGAKYRYYLINKRNDIIIDGFIDGKDWSQTTSKNQFTKTEGAPIPLSIKFDTIGEAKNFIDSTFTEFFSFLMFISKVGVNVQLRYLPYMKDYKEPWTNERFQKYFQISDDDMSFIKNIMKSKNVKI
jgi:hypothetical protein